MSAERRPSSNQEARTNLFARVLGIVFSAVSWLLLGLFISIVVEWLGMTFFWSDKGYKHAQQMYNTEINYLKEDFRESVFPVSPDEFATNMAELSYRYTVDALGLHNLLLRIKRPAHPDDPWHVKAARTVRDYLLAAVFVTQTYAVRLTVIILAIPLWGLVMAYALIKGMNQRALRTWGGGRESGTKFHWGVLVFSSSIAIPFIVYLAWPDTIHPTYVMLPGSIVLGYITYFIVSNYKKYL